MSRDFKGIWIPKEIWLNKDFLCSEKCLWSEIDSLYDQDRGGCYASNEYLAEFLNLKERRVREMISKLKSLGWLEQVSFDGRTRVLKAVTPRPDFKPSSGKKPNGSTGAKKPARQAPERRSNRNQNAGLAHGAYSTYNKEGEQRRGEITPTPSFSESVEKPPVAEPPTPQGGEPACAGTPACAGLVVFPSPVQIDEEKRECIEPPVSAPVAIKKETPKKKEKSKQQVSHVGIELAKFTIERMQAKNKMYIPANPAVIASHLEKIVTDRLGKCTIEDVKQAIDWALNDSFWSKNMYGGKKNIGKYIQQNFERFHMAMQSKPPNKVRKFDPCSDDKAALRALEEMGKYAI